MFYFNVFTKSFSTIKKWHKAIFLWSLTGLNSTFPFSKISLYIKDKEPCRPYYLPYYLPIIMIIIYYYYYLLLFIIYYYYYDYYLWFIVWGRMHTFSLQVWFGFFV